MCTFPLSRPGAPAYWPQFFTPTVADSMRQAHVSHTTALSKPRRRSNGFTLIEVMIVVAIVAILAAVAIPSYRDYILRGQLVDATTLLATTRADMERYYQDNRTYSNVSAAITAPCVKSMPNWDLSCSAQGAQNFTLLVVGKNATNGFSYSIDQSDTRLTLTLGGSWPTPTPPNNQCWVLKRGQTC
jgi:prepilin-type N-terminal cleavage/methylation domain-containing protein